MFGIRNLRGQRVVFPGCGAGHAGRGHTACTAGRKRRSLAKHAAGIGKAERPAVAPGGMLGKGNENHRDDARIQATETCLRAAATAAVMRRPRTAPTVDRRGETETG